MVIYKTTNKLNGKWYIGKDANNRTHYLGSGKAITAAIKKYGPSNFEKTILEECNSLVSLSLQEKYWIAVTNAVAPSVVSNLVNVNHILFQKQTKGWRFRKETQEVLPPYVNKRKLGHPNISCKGRTWKQINGVRVWQDRPESRQ